MKVAFLVLAVIGGALITLGFLPLLIFIIARGGWAPEGVLVIIAMLCGVIGIAIPVSRRLGRWAAVVVLGVGVTALVAIGILARALGLGLVLPGGAVLLMISGVLGVWTSWKPSMRRSCRAPDDARQ